MNNDQTKQNEKLVWRWEIEVENKMKALVAMLMKKKTKYANAHNRCYSANDSVIRQMMKIITQKKRYKKK